MITESQLLAIEECDEYSLRHYSSEIQDLIDSYRQSQEALARFLRWTKVVADCEGVKFTGDHPLALAEDALINYPGAK
jgi:hypothetical protein